MLVRDKDKNEGTKLAMQFKRVFTEQVGKQTNELVLAQSNFHSFLYQIKPCNARKLTNCGPFTCSFIQKTSCQCKKKGFGEFKYF